MAPIVLSQVSKIYRGGVEAVRDVSFSVPSGAICVLTGPTGAGKSTLLRLIANREPVTSGLIEIGDAASQSWRIGRADVVELAEARGLDPKAHVYGAMARGLKARGLKRAEAESRTLEAADAMELGALMARKTGTLSSGEASLAAFARAIAHRTRAILFDEPFVGLDPARRLALRREMRKLAREGVATLVVATHDQADALALADVLVVMDRGRVAASGAPADLYGRPATADLARLLGAPPMNVLPVRANQTGLSLEDGTHLGAASVMTTATFALLGVRPEDLFVAGEGAPPAAAILPVEVEEIERAGHESVVHGTVGPFPIVARIAGTISAPAQGPLRLGARRDSLHMFEAVTGLRL